MANRRAVPYTVNADGLLDSISIYHRGISGQMLLAVYSDDGGLPGTRLGVTSTSMLSSTHGWQTIDLQSPISVSAGQRIWLGSLFESDPEIGSSGGILTTLSVSALDDFIYSLYANWA